ncbi:HAMP domain-containing protein [Priestia megaterium]|nr:HAMP domain-containing protein [Priestia megaterium]
MKFLSNTKNSILFKYILSFVIPIAVFSIIFSVTLYTFSMSIVNKHVVVQFEKSLGLILEDVMENIDSSLVEEANSGNGEKYQKLVKVLNNSQQKHNVENAYVLAKKDGKEYIVALSNTDENGAEYSFSEEMNKALEGTTEFSDIYEDEFGIHKSIFTPIEGTDMIAGIDMDASFIKELKTEILMLALMLTLIFVGLGIVIAYVISKRITNPLMLILQYVKQVANGDLAIKETKVKGTDEIAQLAEGIEGMVHDLHTLINQIDENAQQVAATSEELTASVEQTSQSITQVTESMEEVASGAENQVVNVEQMNKGVADISKGMQLVTNNVKEVTVNSEGTSNIAENGNEVIEVAVQRVNTAYQTIKQTSEVVHRLSDHTKEIGDIVSLITEITDQTNLLALNASIEAARAGEHGKGFAVVAEEVRKLAEQSRNAANKITNRIETIKTESFNAVEAMSTGYHALKEGVSTFENAGTAFRDILKSVDGVNKQISAVNTAIADMNKGVQQIAQSMEGLTAISTQTSGNIQNVAAAAEEQSATIEEIAASSHNLSKMAENLYNAVQKFKL